MKIKLKNFARFIAGQSPKSEYYSKEEGLPFLQGNRTFGFKYPLIDTYTKKVTKVAKKGEILISVRAPVGDLNISPKDVCIGRGLGAISAIDGDNNFLYYALKYNIHSLLQQGTGTTYSSVNADIINNLILEIPEEINARKSISNLLSNIDNKIVLNNKINDELESMAKTIYDYWFLQFEFPNEEGEPYKSSGGKMVWNEELKREIPEGWTNGLISDLGEIISGGTPSTKHDEYYSKNGIAWITPYDLSKTTDKYITHGEKDISQKGLEKSSAKLMPKGSILLTSRAPIGYIGISSNEVTTNQGFKSIVPYNKSNSEYIYYLLKSIIPYLKSLGNGSTFAEISKETLSNIPIVIPNKDIIDNFNNKVIHLGKIREIKEQENRELTSLRDFLLPLLMNGQVGFKDKENKSEG